MSIFRGSPRSEDFISLNKEISMENYEQMIKSLIATAHQGDISFADVYQAAAELLPHTKGTNMKDLTMHLVSQLLSRGMVPVTSPYASVPGTPWVGDQHDAILVKINQAFAALGNEPGFMDICWFRDRYR